MGLQSLFYITKSEITCTATGSTIMFRGIQTGSKDNSANLKSLQGVTTLVIDEAEEVTDENVFDKIDLSVRQKGAKNRVILILNPTTKESWIYRRFHQDAGVPEGSNCTKGNTTYIHTDYRDNLENLDESFLKQVEEIRKNQPIKYNHVILGGWLDRAEGVIFQNWKVGDFNDDLPYGFGQDYGFSVDPTTLIKCAVDMSRKIIYVKEMLYKTGLSTTQIYEHNVVHAGTTHLIVGDSQEKRLLSELKALKLNIAPCIKGPGSVTAGVSAMQDFTIIVDPDSINIAKELNNYVWHDKIAKTPVDAYNHAIDAIRYYVYPIIKRKKEKGKVGAAN